ncbi:MAG: type II secretion system protein [Phycisphaerales bacterium JB050]
MTYGTDRLHTAARRGFTLIELLVVVAVIALLIGILLPALGKARESAYRAQSASNLKNIQLIMQVYAVEYDGVYPIVTPGPGGVVGQTSRIIPPTTLFTRQSDYGGFAGFFNLDQQERAAADGLQTSWTRDYAGYPVYSNGSWKAVSFTSPNRKPLLRAYMEDGPGDFAVLQNPADDSDGDTLEAGGDPGRWPFATPGEIKEEKDVVWYNISYFYVAGLKNNEAARVAFLGDETNANDIGGGQFSSGYAGTLRSNLAFFGNDKDRTGYQPQDNHGSAGGNFCFTDGSVEWIGGKDTAHNQIFDQINRRWDEDTMSEDERRSNQVMSVD